LLRAAGCAQLTQRDVTYHTQQQQQVCATVYRPNGCGANDKSALMNRTVTTIEINETTM